MFNSRFVLGVYRPTQRLYGRNHHPPRHKLLIYEDVGLLEHDTFGAALALEPRHDLADAIELVADRVSALRFCEDALARNRSWSPGNPT
jgi:hypothetical protein